MYKRVAIISAMGLRNRGIGYRGGLPWHIPEEYKIFLDHAKSATIIMGRKSFDVFGADLQNSTIIVLSRKPFLTKGAELCSNIEDALELARSFDKPIYVSGGAQIYKLALPYCHKMYLSFIKKDYPADTFFPEYDEDEWRLVSEQDHPQFFHQELDRRKDI